MPWPVSSSGIGRFGKEINSSYTGNGGRAAATDYGLGPSDSSGADWGASEGTLEGGLTGAPQ